MYQMLRSWPTESVPLYPRSYNISFHDLAKNLGTGRPTPVPTTTPAIISTCWTVYPTNNGGMQNGSSVGTYTHCITRFCTFGTDSCAQSVLINKNFCIGAQSEVYWVVGRVTAPHRKEGVQRVIWIFFSFPLPEREGGNSGQVLQPHIFFTYWLFQTFLTSFLHHRTEMKGGGSHPPTSPSSLSLWIYSSIR